MPSSWRCVLIGNEHLLLQCANLLIERGHQIAAVVTTREPIAEWARSRSIPVLQHPRQLLDAGLDPFEYLFSITNLTILSSALLDLPVCGAINFHDGPLPLYGGVNAPAWALLNHERQHGVTWHRMTRDVDGGEILAAREFAIDEGETAFSLNTKCFSAGLESFEQLLAGLMSAAAFQGTPPQGPARLFGRRDRPAAACAIQWHHSAEQIAATARALDFGRHANPLGMMKMSFAGAIILVGQAVTAASDEHLLPGVITHIDTDAIVVGTGKGAIALSRLATPHGGAISITDAAARFGLSVGARFDMLDEPTLARLTAINADVAAHEDYWRTRLASLMPIELPIIQQRAMVAEPVHSDHPPVGARSSSSPTHSLLAAIVAYFGRLCDKARFDIGYTDPMFDVRYGGLENWFSAQVPLRADLDFGAGFEDLRERLNIAVQEIHRKIGFTADLIMRTPGLETISRDNAQLLPISLHVVGDLETMSARLGTDLTIAVDAQTGASRWFYDRAKIEDHRIRWLQQGVANLLAAAEADQACPIGMLPLLGEDEAQNVLDQWAVVTADWRTDACLHELFSEQAARTPDATALTCRGVSLSYRDLDLRSNQLAHRLAAMGVGPDTLVGLHCNRSPELLIALWGILKAGGAYVPLDPAYPADRLEHMIRDSAVGVIITQAPIADRLPAGTAETLLIDAEWASISRESAQALGSGVTPANLAYVIYTSGSTGRPKGVMVEHRNVSNFFTGMDQRIASPGVWMAVTSLSFDISVLELCWTMARGFHAILSTGDEFKAAPSRGRPIDFSLFYFAADEAVDTGPKYRLLLEGAKFADENGFAAIWTPERHFHAFGGLYANPSVTGAAIAAITNRVKIRAGSIVLPLHHPARVAEEWAMVDNLSNGRVGVAFASGWQPNDFAIRPEAYSHRHQELASNIETVRKLWRGDSHAFPGPLGEPVEVKTLPRPIQHELPIWITSAGNVETFRMAGRLGASVLTHLLGQTVEEVAEKIGAYRAARREAGHDGDGHVTLMLHTFVGPDAESVKAIVREPLITYLRTATNLVEQYAWSFPAFKRRPGMLEADGQADLAALSDADMDSLLDYAADRYYENSGLFGTPQSCAIIIQKIRSAGVDEVGCLIDFGIDTDITLAHLPFLDQLRMLTTQEDQPNVDEGFGATMLRHGVTHLQCTPSMARMLLADNDAVAAIRSLRHLMIGGEPFPPPLARQLHALATGSVSNMYGPTETTIWSTVHDIGEVGTTIPLGKPLANQQVHILDSRQQPVPPDVPGEIVIGGPGVVRGYLNRPDLTAERFIVAPNTGERLYRTGDLGRRRPDGVVEFLGRLDHQVKIRGHRIELGEIEATIGDHIPASEVVVVARADDGHDLSLVAYVTPLHVDLVELRAFLHTKLPDFMVPDQFVTLSKLPKTPNGKIDRNALPAPAERVVQHVQENFVAPMAGAEERIATIWKDILKLNRVGSRDNFFDLGGHSLLAVQMHQRLRLEFSRDFPLTDIFRFPTPQTLGAHLSGAGDDAAPRAGQNRARERRAALMRRSSPGLVAAGGN